MTIQKSYQKPCKYCGQSEIYWSDLKKYFTNTDGAKHSCPNSSAKDRQLDADRKLNEMLNDIKSQMSNEHNDEVQRIDALQRSTARNASILTEIKAKLDGVLRGFT